MIRAALLEKANAQQELSNYTFKRTSTIRNHPIPLLRLAHHAKENTTMPYENPERKSQWEREDREHRNTRAMPRARPRASPTQEGRNCTTDEARRRGVAEFLPKDTTPQIR